MVCFPLIICFDIIFVFHLVHDVMVTVESRDKKKEVLTIFKLYYLDLDKELKHVLVSYLVCQNEMKALKVSLSSWLQANG